MAMDRASLDHILKHYPIVGHILTEAYQRDHELRAAQAGGRTMVDPAGIDLDEVAEFHRQEDEVVGILYLDQLGLISSGALGKRYRLISLTPEGRELFEQHYDRFKQYRKPHHTYDQRILSFE